ncbi:hypothetical protein C2S52_021810 [Perilla frutescens var. hirtella]|nr:hypothetical protein C2S52_021810 [Perilla frutescens var. hirtella]
MYPAIAIADQLKILNPNAQFLYAGTPTGMEAKAIPSAGFLFSTVLTIPLSCPFLSPRNLFVLPLILTSSVFKNLKILHEFGPNIVIDTGGFVSFPTCLTATIKGIKLLIQE